MGSEASFTLESATRDDIPRMTEIHVVACLPDTAISLYFDSNAEFYRRVNEMLEGQVGDPAWNHVKAVDSATGTLAAWASWQTPPDDELRLEATKLDAAAAADESDVRLPTKEPEKPRKGQIDFPPGLATYVRADTACWLAQSTYRRRHVRCKALFTDPSFQRRGMGSALVRHGNVAADAAGLPIFLQASPHGFPTYERCGFHTVRHLDVDLRDWAPGARGGDKGYGAYRFRYMLRLPETLPETLPEIQLETRPKDLPVASV